jgi:hypothetical protein
LAWQEVEKASVVLGVRAGAIVTVTPEGLPDLTLWALSRDLVAVPMNRAGSIANYSATTAEPVKGRPWVYRVLLGRSGAVLRLSHQDAILSDDDTVGKLLGYPQCCREFFKRYWVDEQWVDTTWPMYEAARTGDGPMECNTLLRWLGVRLVPHLPCSFRCDASVVVGRKMERVWIEEGYETELAWVKEALGWGATWSSLHGIAEVTTDVLRVVTRSDAFSSEAKFKRAGKTADLEEGAGAEWEWEQNGFGSLTAMREAHRPVAEIARESIEGAHAMIDLGCGNGALLRRILAGNGQIRPWGVDLDPKRIKAARERDPDGVWIAGDLRNGVELPKGQPVLLMPGRLLEDEADEGGRDRLLDRLKGRTVIAYAYQDWLTTAGSLKALCEAAGLDWQPVSRVAQGEHSAAVALQL